MTALGRAALLAAVPPSTRELEHAPAGPHFFKASYAALPLSMRLMRQSLSLVLARSHAELVR